jgi:hypothetical protein
LVFNLNLLSLVVYNNTNSLFHNMDRPDVAAMFSPSALC